MATTFKDFVNESREVLIYKKEDFIADVRQNCKKFLQHSSPDHLVYRGMKSIARMAYLDVRSDRIPSDTDRKTHQLLDDMFNEEFGFKYRSAGLFAATTVNHARFYGTPYIIFPVGNYNIIGSDDVKDLYVLTSSGRAIFTFETAKQMLNKDDYAKYYLMKTSHNKFDFSDEEINKLNQRIFDKLNYEESLNPADFKEQNEIMIDTKRYYFLQVNNTGWDTSDDVVAEIYK
jgi:hypothetical protein